MTSARAAASAELLGEVGGRYVLRREIARGGMSAVFEAEHLFTLGRVALKILHERTRDDAEAKARLLLEGQLLARMRHPSIVTVHDAGICARVGPFVVLELIDGRPLDGVLLARKSLPVEQCVALVVRLCDALEASHAAGVVHRDVKPSNVFLEVRPGGRCDVKLLDFGVAADSQVVSDRQRLTKAGDVLGTLEYMAPEQLMGTLPIAPGVDVYAVGVLLYECLTGRLPYNGSATALITHFLQQLPPDPIDGADVPRALQEVVLRALRMDPSARYASPSELAAACIAAVGGRVAPLALLAEPAASTETPSGAQRRQFQRAAYVAPTRLRLTDGSVCDGRTEDISEGGVLMIIDTPCRSDETVVIRLPLPSTGRVVALEGTTRWVRANRGRQAIGVAFREVPPEVLAEIRGYVGLVGGRPEVT